MLWSDLVQLFFMFLEMLFTHGSLNFVSFFLLTFHLVQEYLNENESLNNIVQHGWTNLEATRFNFYILIQFCKKFNILTRLERCPSSCLTLSKAYDCVRGSGVVTCNSISLNIDHNWIKYIFACKTVSDLFHGTDKNLFEF